MRAADFGREELDRDALVPILRIGDRLRAELRPADASYEENKRVTVDQFNTKMDNSKFVTGKRLGYDFDIEDI